jgi:hypothetical protein
VGRGTGGVGWSALRDIATALVWSGALGESVALWFGVRFVWAPNGRRADGDITDRLFGRRVRAAHAPSRKLSGNCGEVVAICCGYVSRGRFAARPDPKIDELLMWSISNKRADDCNNSV